LGVGVEHCGIGGISAILHSQRGIPRAYSMERKTGLARVFLTPFRRSGLQAPVVEPFLYGASTPTMGRTWRYARFWLASDIDALQPRVRKKSVLRGSAPVARPPRADGDEAPCHLKHRFLRLHVQRLR